MKQRFKDITGFRFGKLTVIEMATTRKNPKNIDWVCKCDCGNMTTVIGTKLRKENGTKSCGCLINENRFVKHNMSKTREYHSWSGMLDRCYNANSKYYHLYGGRGIEMCPEWARVLGISSELLSFRVTKFGVDEAFTMTFGRWGKREDSK